MGTSPGGDGGRCGWEQVGATAAATGRHQQSAAGAGGRAGGCGASGQAELVACWPWRVE